MLRFETIYRYGGFYLDTNMEIMKPLNPLLRYPLVATQSLAGRGEDYMESGFLATTKGSPIMLKAI